MAVRPLPSVTVHSTVVVPKGYVLEGWLFEVLATVQLSLVVGEPRLAMVAVQRPEAVFAVGETGQEMVGGVWSTFVIFAEHVLVFPLASVAVNVTVIVPTPETMVPAKGLWVIVTPEAPTQISLDVIKLV